MQLTRPAPRQLVGAVLAADPGVLRTARWKSTTKVAGSECWAWPPNRGFGQPSPPALRGVPGVTPLASRRPRAAPPCLEHLHSHQENEAHGPGSGPSWVGERSGTPQLRQGAVRLRALRGVRACSPAEAQSACGSSSCVACRSSHFGVARWLLRRCSAHGRSCSSGVTLHRIMGCRTTGCS